MARTKATVTHKEKPKEKSTTKEARRSASGSGPVKKPHRYRSGTRARMNSKRLIKLSGTFFCIKTAGFVQLFRQAVAKTTTEDQIRCTRSALQDAHYGIEDWLIRLLTQAKTIQTIVAKKLTLDTNHVWAAYRCMSGNSGAHFGQKNVSDAVATTFPKLAAKFNKAQACIVPKSLTSIEAPANAPKA